MGTNVYEDQPRKQQVQQGQTIGLSDTCTKRREFITARSRLPRKIPSFQVERYIGAQVVRDDQ